MNLAIVGYGKMGRLIEQLAPQYGFAVKLNLDSDNNASGEGITRQNLSGVDAAVEFSVPSATLGNVERLASLGVNMVVGTTGWLDHLERVRSVVEKTGIGFVWSPNYSIGVSVFLRIVSETARLLANEAEYGAWAWGLSPKIEAGPAWHDSTEGELNMFTGCGTALVTPFRQDYSLDETALRRLVRRQIHAGINFLVPCGTTGENPTLTRAEHLRVVEITLEEAKGKIPVLAGAGGYKTTEGVELAEGLKTVGVDGVFSVTPD